MTQQRDVPESIRLVAAVSRLLDLHQTCKSVYISPSSERGGSLLGLGLMVLDTMCTLEQEQGRGLFAIHNVFIQLKKIMEDVDEEDFNLVIESLAAEGEIKYTINNQNGELESGATKGSTALLIKPAGTLLVELSANGRLFLRINDLKHSWLYTDVEALKLDVAIDRQQFQDIPVICKQLLLEIASQSQKIQNAIDRPTLSQLRDALLNNGDIYSESIENAKTIVFKSLDKIYKPHMVNIFESWLENNNVNYTLGNIQAEIDILVQRIEDLSRKYVLFLEHAQKAKVIPGEGISFQKIIDSMLKQDFFKDTEQLQKIVGRMMPWSLLIKLFEPDSLVNAIDLRKLMEQKTELVVLEEDLSEVGTKAQSRLQIFIEAHKEIILERLKHKPYSFSELIQSGFELEDGEVVADFCGIYSSPTLLGDEYHFVFGLTQNSLSLKFSKHEYIGEDPVLFLMENK